MRVVQEFRNSNRKQQHFLRTLLLDQESAPLLQRQQSRNIMKRHPHQAYGSIPYGAHMRKKIIMLSKFVAAALHRRFIPVCGAGQLGLPLPRGCAQGECRLPGGAGCHGVALSAAQAQLLAIACAPSGQVNLGLLPGAQGTQRLPRVAALPVALPMILQGRPMNVARLTCSQNRQGDGNGVG